MLDSGKVATALKKKQKLFQDANRQLQTDLAALHKALATWANRPASEIETILSNVPWPGALPTSEQDTQPLIMPFTQQWENHRQARGWALKTLEGVTTFAVDGSQILPTNDLSIPVSLVQIGWFKNRHVKDDCGDFEKDIAVEVLTSGELFSVWGSLADNEVNWRRFQGEATQLERFMKAHAGRSKYAVAFFDGSLILKLRYKDYVKVSGWTSSGWRVTPITA